MSNRRQENVIFSNIFAKENLVRVVDAHFALWSDKVYKSQRGSINHVLYKWPVLCHAKSSYLINSYHVAKSCCLLKLLTFLRLLMTFANKLDPDEAPQNVRPHLRSNLFETHDYISLSSQMENIFVIIERTKITY